MAEEEMRVQRNLILPVTLILILGATLVLPTMAEAQASAPAKAAWTVLVYLDADNDLERPMMKNLEEMLKAGRSDQVNVIVLAARNPEGVGKYTNAAVANLPNWTSGKLLRVEPGKLQELADWGAVDTGDESVLQRFLSRATTDFPAERYALIFGDHGMAWAGVAVSESMGDGDSLSIDEIADALKAVQPNTGRFELIGFDACVMANLEVARALAPYARYLVASEEIEPSEGWDYATLLTKLAQTPAMDGVRLGRTIADTYRDFYAQSTSHERAEKAKALTLTVIALDQIPAVDRAVVSLGAGADGLLGRGGHAAWLHLAQARHATEEFGRSAAPSGSMPPGSEVYDLVQVAENVKLRAQDNASGTAAGAVIAAVNRAIVYNIRGEARPHANGLSIFFPPNQTALAMRGKTSYKETSFAANNSWYPFLKDYVSVPASDAERNRPKPPLDPVTASGRMLSHDGKVALSSKIKADDIDEVRFVVSIAQGGQRIVIGSIPIDLDASGDLKENWDGGWFTISDNDGEFIAPITQFEELKDLGNEEVYWAGVPARLRLAGTDKWLDVTLYFELDFRDEEASGDFIYAVEYTPNGPLEIDLDAGDDLQPVYELIDANGVSQRSVTDEPSHLIHIDDDVDELKVKRSELPPGHYLVGFVVSDLAGRQSEQLTEVEVAAAAPDVAPEVAPDVAPEETPETEDQ
jgi:Clostripain family